MTFIALRILPSPSALAALASSAMAQDMTGAGATFPAPIYAKWADAYKRRPACA